MSTAISELNSQSVSKLNSDRQRNTLSAAPDYALEKNNPVAKTETNSSADSGTANPKADIKSKSETTDSIENLLAQLQSSAGATSSLSVSSVAKPAEDSASNASAIDSSSQSYNFVPSGLNISMPRAEAPKIQTTISTVTSGSTENYEAADSNEDGKVTLQEASVYAGQQLEKQQAASKSTSKQEAINQANVAQAMQAYALGFDMSGSQISTSA